MFSKKDGYSRIWNSKILKELIGKCFGSFDASEEKFLALNNTYCPLMFKTCQRESAATFSSNAYTSSLIFCFLIETQGTTLMSKSELEVLR